MIYRELIYSILDGLKQTFPDRDLGLYEVLYHVQLQANLLKAQVFKKYGSTGRWMSTFNGIPTTIASNGLPYVIIPKQVYNFDMEGGIVNISYTDLPEDPNCDPPTFAQVQFQPTKLDEVHALYYSEYTKPKAQNPYFYRVTDRIYLLGVNSIALNDVNVVLYVALNPRDVIDLDEVIDLPDEYISQLTYNVLSLGRFIANIPDERRNDGADKQWEEQQQGLKQQSLPNATQAQ